MSKSQVKKLAKKYAAALREAGIKFEHLYLFGSYAKGTNRKDSDIDIAVVSKKVAKGEKFIDGEAKMWGMTLNVDTRIEPIWISSKDLEEKCSVMAIEISETGVLIE